MKKSLKTLIIAVVFLALLCGGYFFAVKWQPKKSAEKENDVNDVLDSSQYLSLTDEEDKKTDSVEIHCGDISYIIKNGEKTTLLSHISSVTDESAVSRVFSSALNISGAKEVKGAKKDNPDYGIADSDNYIVINGKDKTAKKVIFGKSANFDNRVYAACDNSNAVYTVSESTMQSVMVLPQNLRNLDICEIDNTSITGFSLIRGGASVIDISYVEKTEDEKQNEALAGMATYTMNYPYKGVKASSDRVGELFKEITSLSANAIAAEGNANLKEYGLDSPTVLKIKDSGGEHTIKIGKKSENGYYIMYNDSNVVYIADCPFASTAANLKADDFIDRFIHIFDIGSVKKIDVKAPDASYTLKIKGNTQKDSAKYYLNDKKVAEDSFKKAYQSIIGVMAADIEKSIPGGDVQYEITFTFDDKTKKTFSYYRFNERYSIVKADSGLICTTLTDNLKNITEVLDKTK